MDTCLPTKGEAMEKHIGDRRVKRTRQMLHHALLSLIEERGYDALSIQDITERANIGRATFYVHYQDKEQLLLDSVNAVMEDLKSHYQSASAIDIFMKRQTFSVVLFQHVFEHASLYRALLSERGAALISTRLQREVAARMQQQVIEPLLALATVKLPADLLAEHCAASLWSLVAWWLRNDFPKSIEEMGRIFWHLINQGLLQTLGVLAQEESEEETVEKENTWSQK
jgi:AcrR family transcriptional regulator